jgi:hypothetical protein
MKALDLKEATVSMGAPIQLGGRTTKTGMGGALVRVKQRLLFVYFYTEYKNEETVTWLRKATEDWVDAILEANN